ncbi:outer membrane beta-barrel protein [Flavobacterium sp. LS2P90]|uniref:Outer membrane beta-barrel protein n=1 Tax=Flavobacterium xylosi TaxID=3230415 RepID=A0ABW6HY88_9FLAO
MKKIILTAAAVFAFGFANAQDTRYGVKAGVDFASIKFKYANVSGTETKKGVYIGVFADAEISEKFHLQPEILYVSLKDFNQVQVLINAKYEIFDSVKIFSGPNLGFFTSADQNNAVNVGLDFGVSYNLTENVSIDAKYNLGLTNFLKLSDDNSSSKLNGLYVGLGYRF